MQEHAVPTVPVSVLLPGLLVVGLPAPPHQSDAHAEHPIAVQVVLGRAAVTRPMGGPRRQ